MTHSGVPESLLVERPAAVKDAWSSARARVALHFQVVSVLCRRLVDTELQYSRLRRRYRGLLERMTSSAAFTTPLPGIVEGCTGRCAYADVLREVLRTKRVVGGSEPAIETMLRDIGERGRNASSVPILLEPPNTGTGDDRPPERVWREHYLEQTRQVAQLQAEREQLVRQTAEREAQCQAARRDADTWRAQCEALKANTGTHREQPVVESLMEALEAAHATILDYHTEHQQQETKMHWMCSVIDELQRVLERDVASSENVQALISMLQQQSLVYSRGEASRPPVSRGAESSRHLSDEASSVAGIRNDTALKGVADDPLSASPASCTSSSGRCLRDICNRLDRL
ncbi:hypothetical protein CDCA_CDCA06G1816 [Cyanidium caldarium]|uniref:Uncharacterized protein n=1 Tax=Cyanidium caldarium TaxID=2771 RepID=A0AAV9IUF1_CYACA|nr:hypothetical protein CDCA_CDCA06G1816 [Cyanidium caldarium]